MYFGEASFYELIRKIGGQWNDSKERPIVCLMKSYVNENIYWAIPVGNWEHRDAKAQARILKYINLDNRDIRSCFYHIGSTDVKSIFFISDVVPITEKYINREYIGKYSKNIFIIKNKQLKKALQVKLSRILGWENSNPNYFRQHITDIKKYLINEMHS